MGLHQALSQVITFLLGLDPAVYVGLLGGAVGVSIVGQWAKKLLKLSNEKYVELTLNIIAFAASGLGYFLSNSHLPPYVLGISTVALRGLAQPLYIYVVKPLSTFISNVQAYKSSIVTKAEQVAAVAATEPNIPDDVVAAAASALATAAATTTTTTTTTTPAAATITPVMPSTAAIEPEDVTPADTRPVAGF